MINIYTNASLLDYNTFGIDVKASVIAEYETIEGLKTILRSPFATPYINNTWSIGQGSNLLFKQDFDGLILHGKIKGIELISGAEEGLQYVKVGAGEIWDDVAEWLVIHQLYGGENLSAIPGEIGAAAVQNIGAYGAEFGVIVKYVEVLNKETLEIEHIDRESCEYAYRDSIFKHDPYKQRYIVTGVMLEVSKHSSFKLEYGNISKALEGKEITLMNVRNTIINIRGNKLPDPKILGNAGSFFKNPIVPLALYNEIKIQYPTAPCYPIDENNVKVPAGWLIENSGLKGFSHGGAKVYEKQCLVLVNYNKAKPNDIVELANIVIEKVKSNFGIEISPEVNII